MPKAKAQENAITKARKLENTKKECWGKGVKEY
jgi:hypothetical protein